MIYDKTEKIIAAAIEVHRHLGPGLLESCYEECLAHELELRQIHYERQKYYPLVYKNLTLPAAYRVDFLVENEIIIELKSVSALDNIHLAQVLTYLRLFNLKTGLLLNFNVALMKDGIKRVSR